VLKNPDRIKNRKWQIEEFLHMLNIPRGHSIIKDMASNNRSSGTLNIKSRLEISMLSSRMLPEEFADLKNSIKYFDTKKVLYEEEKSFGDINNLSNMMDITRPVTIVGRMGMAYSAKTIGLIANTIGAVRRKPQNLVEKCLESVVVIDVSSGGGGSGFVVNNKGYIVTNYHVIADQKDIIVKTKNGKKFFADLIEVVKYKDLALLRINTREVSRLKFGNIRKVSSGDTVYALGSPGGLEQSVTKGVVSAIRALDAPYNPLTKIEIIQTDAALNPGNSGGPLVNERGEVIAVNSQKIVATDVEGISFSISIDEVKKSFAKYL
jgi:S1-C subfamily serine protease